jgi:hypothetical protein
MSIKTLLAFPTTDIQYLIKSSKLTASYKPDMKQWSAE